jgi:anti-sigma factor RsiW
MNPLTEDDRIAVMAWVDGELPAAARADFEARLATDADLARAVEREQALRARLQAAYDPVLDEPMPIGLLDLLSSPVDGRSAAANDAEARGQPASGRACLPWAQRWQWREWGAMAACVVLGVLVGTRLPAPGASTTGGAGATQALAVSGNGAITAQGLLRDALEQHVGGAESARADVAVGLSFRDHAQQYCRTFALAGASSGIACKRDDRWVVANLEQAVTGPASAPAPASAPGSYRMAASPFSTRLLQAVDALREGDTLDAKAEAAARARGWKP